MPIDRDKASERRARLDAMMEEYRAKGEAIRDDSRTLETRARSAIKTVKATVKHPTERTRKRR